MRRLLTIALLATLAACSGGGSTAKSSPTPTVTAGTAAFLTFAHGANFGTKDFASAPDDALLNVGNTACEGFASGLSFGRVVQGFVESTSGPSTAEAEAFTRAAVTNLCPAHTTDLP